MKYKLRFTKLSVVDQQNLEYLLNEYAHEGWYIKKIVFDVLFFEYDPTRDCRIIVVMNYNAMSRLSQAKNEADLQKQLDAYELFDYKTILKYRYFVVLEASKTSQFITDEFVDETTSKPNRKKIFRSVFLEEILSILWYQIMFIGNPVNTIALFIASNYGIMYLLFLCGLMIWIIMDGFMRIKAAHGYYRQYRNPIPQRFKQTKHSSKDLWKMGLFILSIVLFVWVGMTNNPSQFVMIFGILVSLILTVNLFAFGTRSESMTLRRRIVLMISGFISLAMFCVCFMLVLNHEEGASNMRPISDAHQITHLKMESFDRFLEENTQCSFNQSDSLLVTKVEIWCDSQDISVVVSKTEQFLPFVIWSGVGTFNLPEQTSTLSTRGFQTAFRVNHTILLSYREIPQYFIDELNSR
ncbi:hypothetical protein AOC36_08905 [Erysipelothrix larvae]|uniref:DUF2812 domain-containing protein n=1 Tax=Erysipelothrix larvae TaxID=1514105 RepID=A0A0X8H124_9FIRM|nr:hypothetical protein [Erysipelothrix larvae]AMC94102.1 hypothetical protein AOC36_08905 [Erysipelothrix larvae]